MVRGRDGQIHQLLIDRVNILLYHYAAHRFGNVYLDPFQFGVVPPSVKCVPGPDAPVIYAVGQGFGHGVLGFRGVHPGGVVDLILHLRIVEYLDEIFRLMIAPVGIGEIPLQLRCGTAGPDARTRPVGFRIVHEIVLDDDLVDVGADILVGGGHRRIPLQLRTYVIEYDIASVCGVHPVFTVRRHPVGYIRSVRNIVEEGQPGRSHGLPGVDQRT